MKCLSIKFIIELILSFIFMILFLLIGIVFKNHVISWVLTILLFIIIGYILYRLVDWYPNKLNQLSYNKFIKLKSKETTTTFEKLYINAYNDQANDILRNIITQNKIKHVHSLDFDAKAHHSYVSFSFNHKRHSVNYLIYEDKVEFFIDSPAKYDYIEMNKEHEKLKRIYVNINDFDSLEAFFTKLIPTIIKNINDIDQFEDNVNMINITKKTFDEIIDYKDHIKYNNILLVVLVSIFTIIISVLTYWTISDIILGDEEGIILWGSIIGLFWSFIIYSYVYSITMLLHSRKITKDIKAQCVEKLVGKPYKAKILMSSVGYKRSTFKFSCGIKLYFNDPKNTKLILAHYFRPTKEEKKEIIDKILTKNMELQYYRNSKIIINGAEKIKKIINK